MSITAKLVETADGHCQLTDNAGGAENEYDRRVVDGRNIRDADSAFREFASKLDFPDYFGWNANAFADCIADLSWLDRDHVHLVIEHTDDIPESDELAWLPGTLAAADELYDPEVGMTMTLSLTLVCRTGTRDRVAAWWRTHGLSVV